MKKITAFLLTFILLISAIGAVSADDITETLSAVGILPAFQGGENDPVTREELAFMTAKLVGAETEAKATRFADVSADNKYSGDIEYLASLGVVDGTGGGNFNPKDNANFGMAAKMLINILGYGSFADIYGGYPDGYMDVLSKLGLDKNVMLASDAVLTVAQAKVLFHNALTMEINGLTYAEMDGSLDAILTSEKSDSLLAKAFGVSVYNATVTDVTDDGTYLSVLISKNKYDSNPVKLTSGQSATFEVASGITADSFLNVPVTIWVDENETVIKISPQRNVDVRYVNIASVNGDTREGASYAIGNISEITFLDDEAEYEIAEGATMMYNGSYTLSNKKLVGAFAKVVLKDDEIIFIESWDLERGGLITEFNGSNITYLKDGSKKVLRDVAEYDKIVTIIGKRTASLGEISADTLFSYYESGNYIVIVASEKKVVDVFVNESDKYITVGEISYIKDDILYTEDAEIFTTDFAQFLNRNVAAYIGPDSKVWVVKAVSGESSVSEFYGIVSGIQLDSMDEDYAQIELYKLEDMTVTKEIYDITDKTVFNDLLTLDILRENAKNTKGEGIYVFNVNASGRITSVSLPQPIYGFATGKAAISSFGENAFVSVDGKGLYFTGQKLLGIYENETGFVVEFLSWSDVQEKSVGAGTIRFFGKGKDSVPSLIVLSGDLKSIGSYDKYGIITEITDTVNNDGEVIKQVSVISMAGTKNYKMLPEDAKGINANMWITFKESGAFGDSEIIVKSATALGTNYETWSYLVGTDTETGLHKGTAETADKNRIILREVETVAVDSKGNAIEYRDSAYYFHPSQNFFVAYYPDAPVAKFKPATYSDIDDGDTVFWNYRGDGIRGVIVVK